MSIGKTILVSVLGLILFIIAGYGLLGNQSNQRGGDESGFRSPGVRAIVTGPSVAILYSLGAVGFLLMLILGVVVGSTRVRLGYHSTGQVALSFLASVPLTWFIVYVMPRVLPTIFG